MMTVNMTETAKSDLRKIAIYIAAEAKDKDVAIKFVNALRKDYNVLAEFPHTGAFPKDNVLKSMGYRFLVHDEYLTFYTVNEKENTVNIEAVFNAKKDYMRVLKDFIR